MATGAQANDIDSIVADKRAPAAMAFIRCLPLLAWTMGQPGGGSGGIMI
jgi:hypothetical protein